MDREWDQNSRPGFATNYLGNLGLVSTYPNLGLNSLVSKVGALDLLHSELRRAEDQDFWAQKSPELCADTRMPTVSWFAWDLLGFSTQCPASRETPGQTERANHLS